MDEIAQSGTEQEFNIIVILDYINMTFSVIPTNETTKATSIKENEYNKVNSIVVSDEQMAQKYFYNFKRMAVESDEVEEIYNNLDNEYKNIRFSNFEEFEKYIQKSKEKLSQAGLEKWKMNEYENYNQYICQDNLGNYYIFNETAPMQYTLILDTYTVELAEVVQKYDSANIQERVVLNIDKIKQALNSYNYSYVYNKLAEGFKNSKFKTLEEFEYYMTNKLYDNIDIEYVNFSNEGETYIYDVIIKDSTKQENSQGIEMQIIMQLKENRDFIISFNIKE